MKIVIAIDSFKGSLPSLKSGEAVREAALAVYPEADVSVLPVADGGEGTVDALTHGLGGKEVRVKVTGPLGNEVEAKYGLVKEDGLAVMEMSAAAGITLVSPEERDPMRTTTYGVGEMMLHAIREMGSRKILMGIGGSATNDGGAGMLEALGISLLDREGKPIKRGATGLGDLFSIDLSGMAPELSECEITVACDVTNPLLGERGCSAVFGPQKGATPETVRLMDEYLSSYADLTSSVIGRDLRLEAGAGAAGGLGFALLAYLGATLAPGVETVIKAIGLDEKMKDADIVVTGEGRMDGQSAMGKAPAGIAAAAKRNGACVIALCGARTQDISPLHPIGIDAIFPILPAPMTLGEAMDIPTAYNNLKNTAEEAFRLYRAARGN